MRIGLIDVDSHNFPNFALMKISSYHKMKGDDVEWAVPLQNNYDIVYKSKVFTFSIDDETVWNGKVVKGGTGYDIEGRLPEEIECAELDYSIYPQFPFSIQFFSRGCIRDCPFCLVRKKEGFINPVEPMALNPNGKWIEVLDNNFFANPEWKKSVEWLLDSGQKVNLHGVDIRIMNEEQAYWLNKLPLQSNIHIAWDLPALDLTDKLKEVVRYIKPYKLTCYVLIGYNSTIEQDLFRLYTLRELGISPFVMPFRDYENKRKPTAYERDLARWANKKMLFKSCDFKEYSPRKGFKCSEYMKDLI